MKFTRVNIEVERGGEGHELDVTLSSRDGGNPVGGFELPYAADHVGGLVRALSYQVPASGAEPTARSLVPQVEQEEVDPSRIGKRLFDCLLPPGQVRRQYDREMAALFTDADRGVRLQLQLDPRAPHFAELANLPWELMFSPQGDGPQSLDLRVPFSRYIKLPASARRPPFKPPLRILVVMSNPQGVAQLDLERERQRLMDAFDGIPGVELGFLPDADDEGGTATVEAIRDRLVDGKYHVLHYMGHGDFDRSTGEGVLLFETEDDAVDRVTGSDLAWRLADIPTLSLVFLNACNTACAPDSGPVGDLAGVAHALMNKGLPAVVAMQFPITDSAAVAFSAKFYGRLAAGLPVDVAVGEGRRAILEAHGKALRESGTYSTRPGEGSTLEWATPVLFMRVHDGNLFPREPAPGETAASEYTTQEVPAIGSGGKGNGSSDSGSGNTPGGGGAKPGGKGKYVLGCVGLLFLLVCGGLLGPLMCGEEEGESAYPEFKACDAISEAGLCAEYTRKHFQFADRGDQPPRYWQDLCENDWGGLWTGEPCRKSEHLGTCDDLEGQKIHYYSVGGEEPYTAESAEAHCLDDEGWTWLPAEPVAAVGPAPVEGDEPAPPAEGGDAEPVAAVGPAPVQGNKPAPAAAGGDPAPAVSAQPTPSTAASCDAVRSISLCTEYETRYFAYESSAELQALCREIDGAWSSARCPRDGLLGTCDDPDGVTSLLYETGGDPFKRLRAQRFCKGLGTWNPRQ